MRFIELQIIAVTLAVIGQGFIMFKNKTGWLLQLGGIFFLIAINYFAELYFLVISCCISAIVLLAGWFKWRHDEKREGKK